MITAIVKTEDATLARQDGGISAEQVALIKRTIAKGATDDELELFVATCKRMRLDPFARQAFLVKRYDKEEGGKVAAIQVSIDGFRLTAERTGEYRGQTHPQWCGQDGKWVELWTDANSPPFAARVGVHRAGFVEPLYRTARWGSYAQHGKNGLMPMWRQYGDAMLLKCAEALALRAAFPNELSGVYSSDEMGAAPDLDEAPAQRQTKTTEQRMEAIAAGGTRAESRPTTTPQSVGDTGHQDTTDARSAGDTSNHAKTSASPVTGSPTETVRATTATTATGTGGELLDAAAWRARFEAVVIEAAAAGIGFVGEDELGLPIPGVPVPTFGDGAQQRLRGKPYDTKGAIGVVRAIAGYKDFGNEGLVKRLWVCRLVAVHETEKERAAVAPKQGE